MRKAICLALLLIVVVVSADDPVPQPFMEESRDNFGASGDDYMPGVTVWHCGWDILCPEGTPVKAIADGVVVVCSPGGWDDQDRNENYGLVIAHQLQSGQKYYAIYGHLKRIWNSNAHRLMTDDEVRSCRLGVAVSAGEVIGKIGAYSAPHLHLAIYFNPDDASDIPATGLGRQPLPRPEALEYQGVLSYGCWRNPAQWLVTFTNFSGSYNNTLPVGASDGSVVYFLHHDQGGYSSICRSDPLSGTGGLYTNLPDQLEVDDLFAGQGADLYLCSHTGDRHHLYLLRDGSLTPVYEQTGSFNLGYWRPNTKYLPIYRGLKWEILDLATGEVRDRQKVLGGSNSGDTIWGSVLFGNQTWRLLGDDLSLETGWRRPVTWIVDADTQHKIPVEGFPDADCQGFTVFKQKLPEDGGLERVMLSYLYANHYRLLVAKLRPKQEVKRDGYLAEDVRVWGDFPNEADTVPHSTIITRSGELGLVSARVEGYWRIFSVNSEGSRRLLSQ